MDDSLECIFCQKKLVALKLYKFLLKDKKQLARVCEICEKKFDPVNETEELKLVHSEENKLSSGAFPSPSKKSLDSSSENKPTVKHSDIVQQAAIASGIFEGLLIIDEQQDLHNSSDRKYENNVNITKAFDSVSHNTLQSEESKLSSGVFPSSSKKYLDSSSENKPTVKHSGHDIVEQAAIKCGITSELLIIGEKIDSKNSSDTKYENNVNITKAFDSVSLNAVHSGENKLSSAVFPSSSKNHLDISSENKPTVKHSGHDIVKQAAIESGIIGEERDSKNSSDTKYENNVNITKAFDSVSHNTLHSEESKLSSGVFPSLSEKYLDISSENKPIVKHSDHDIVEQAAIKCGITSELLIIGEKIDSKNSSDTKYENNVNITKAFDSVSHNTVHSEKNKLSSAVFPSSSKKHLDSSSENKPTVKHSAHDIVKQAAIESGIIGEEGDLKNSSDRKHEINANIANTFDSISHKMKTHDLCKLFPSHDFTSDKSIIRLSSHDQVEQESVTGGLFVIDNERYLKNSSDRKHESNVNIVNKFDSVSHKMKKPNVVKILPKQNLRSNKSIIRHSSHDQITQEPVTESVVTDGLLVIDEERALKNSSDRKHESNVKIVNTFDSVSHKMKKPNMVKILPKQNLRSNKSIIRHSSHDQITQEHVTESVVTDGLLVIHEERALKNSNDRKHESNVNNVNTFDSVSHEMKKPNPDKVCPKLSSISNKSIRHLSRDEIRQEPAIDNEATDRLLIIDKERYLKHSSDKKCESNINIVNVSDTISYEVQKPSMGELCPEQNSMNNKSSVRHSFQNEVKQELQIESEETDGLLIIDEDREI